MTRNQLMGGLEGADDSARVSDVMERGFQSVQASQPLDVAIERLQSSGSSALLVLDGESVVGILTAEQLEHAVALAQTLSKHAPGPSPLHAT